MRVPPSVLLLHLVQLLSMVLLTTSNDTGYVCPNDCHCATVDLVSIDRVQIVCNIDTIQTDTAFTAIQGPQTVILTIICQPHFISELAPHAFAHLVELEELQLLRCALLELPQSLLHSLPNLRILNIGSPASDLLVPPGFFTHNPNIQALSIYGSMRSLPDGELCGLQQLQHLDLKVNKFERLQDVGINQTSCLPALEALDLSWNVLQSFDVPLRTVAPMIKTLGLSRNLLTEIDPSMLSLDHLSTLDASHNSLRDFSPPDTLHLTEVNLAHNRVTHLNQSWMHGNLIHMNVSHNSITALDKNFCQNAAGLQSLDLAHNRLKDLRQSHFRGCVTLKTLDLSGNLLEKLDSLQFQDQKQLMTLNLNQNQLQEVSSDAFRGLFFLRSLNMSQNRLDAFNSSVWQPLVSLQTLFLAHNQLEMAPGGLGILSQLNLLDLSHNLLTAIEPESYRGLGNLQYLLLKQNVISYLPHSAFAGAPNLVLLNVVSNRISSMEYGTFLGVPKLLYLSLNHNRISDITGVFSVHLKHLQMLWLQGNRLTEIDRDLFPARLTHVDLSDNDIRHIEPYTFQEMLQLSSVNLRSNGLTVLQKSSLAISKSEVGARVQFQLAYNPLSCECQTTFLLSINGVGNARFAYISDYDHLICSVFNGSTRFIKDIAEDDFLCEYDRDCSANSCPCCNLDDEVCECRTYCPQHCTCVKDLEREYNKVNCSGSGPFLMPEEFPPTTKILVLSGRNIGALTAYQFASNLALETLILSNASVSTIESGAFQNLLNLKHLDLGNNALSTLHNYTFEGLQTLHSLSLQHNHLKHLEKGTLNGLLFLQELNLFGNDLSYFDLHVMLGGLNFLRNVSLAGNPWDCSCHTGLQFRNALVQWSPVVSDAKYLTCQTVDEDLIPANMTDLAEVPVLGVEFDQCLNVSETIFVDRLNRGQQVGLVGSLSLLFLVLVSVSLIIYFRRFLEVWLFSKYGLRFSRDKADDIPKQYDAFVSFSQRDLDFVLQELMPQLESAELPYRLCVHYRDWPVGEAISNNVAQSVDNSHRTILLLSDNFMQSEWCNYEFQAAHHRVLQDRSCHLIVILLQDEPPQDLDRDMQLYINTHTYLKRSDPWFWQKLKLALPKLSTDEIQRRQTTRTDTEMMLEKQRQAMKKLNYRFQDGTVVQV